MEIWFDGAQSAAVGPLAKLGLITGITTNPKILSQQAMAAVSQIKDLLEIQSGPVAVQVTANTEKGMLTQVRKLYDLSDRIIIKVPVTTIGFQVIPQLIKARIPTLATAVFGAEQFLLAAKLGVDYVAPYLHQMQQNGIDTLEELALMQGMIQQYGFKTKVMAASIQDYQDIKKFARLGIAAVTLPAKCLADWLQTHPLTEEGTRTLNDAWAAFAPQYAGSLFDETP